MSWFQNETVDLNALFVKTILFALAGATMAWTMYSYSLCFEKNMETYLLQLAILYYIFAWLWTSWRWKLNQIKKIHKTYEKENGRSH